MPVQKLRLRQRDIYIVVEMDSKMRQPLKVEINYNQLKDLLLY